MPELTKTTTKADKDTTVRDKAGTPIKLNDKVQFRPNWRSHEDVVAKVTKVGPYPWVMTTDGSNFKRKVRGGGTTIVESAAS